MNITRFDFVISNENGKYVISVCVKYITCCINLPVQKRISQKCLVTVSGGFIKDFCYIMRLVHAT